MVVSGFRSFHALVTTNKTKYVLELCDLTCAKISGIFPWFSFYFFLQIFCLFLMRFLFC